MKRSIFRRLTPFGTLSVSLLSLGRDPGHGKHLKAAAEVSGKMDYLTPKLYRMIQMERPHEMAKCCRSRREDLLKTC